MFVWLSIYYIINECTKYTKLASWFCRLALAVSCNSRRNVISMYIHMCVCECVNTYVYIFIYMHIHAYIHILYMHVRVCIYDGINIYIYAHIHGFICYPQHVKYTDISPINKSCRSIYIWIDICTIKTFFGN